MSSNSNNNNALNDAHSNFISTWPGLTSGSICSGNPIQSITCGGTSTYTGTLTYSGNGSSMSSTFFTVPQPLNHQFVIDENLRLEKELKETNDELEKTKEALNETRTKVDALLDYCFGGKNFKEAQMLLKDVKT